MIDAMITESLLPFGNLPQLPVEVHVGQRPIIFRPYAEPKAADLVGRPVKIIVDPFREGVRRFALVRQPPVVPCNTLDCLPYRNDIQEVSIRLGFAAKFLQPFNKRPITGSRLRAHPATCRIVTTFALGGCVRFPR